MTGDWNAHLAFYCTAVTITEVEGQNTHPTSTEWREK